MHGLTNLSAVAEGPCPPPHLLGPSALELQMCQELARSGTPRRAGRVKPMQPATPARDELSPPPSFVQAAPLYLPRRPPSLRGW
eukprot:6181072-Pleurochrysis_carterae.AAC.1